MVALLAFKRSKKRNPLTHIIIPILGFIANLVMLLAVLYLGILGGGATQTASIAAIIVALVWLVIGIVYLNVNSKKQNRPIIIKE